MPADVLSLHRAASLNASGLFREVLTEQMTSRNIDRDELLALVAEALRNKTYDLDELVEQTSGLENLEELLEAPDVEPPQYE